MSYGGETKVLKFEISRLYSIPTAIFNENLITSNFAAISDKWLPALSEFYFSDHLDDYVKDAS
jgi:hypothetical protein